MPLIPKKPIFLRFCNKDRKDSHALTITEIEGYLEAAMAVVAVIDSSFAISASQVSLYDYTSEETVILTIIIVLLSVSILSLIEFTWNVGQHSSAHRRSHGDSWHQESLKQKKVIVENSVAKHVAGHNAADHNRRGTPANPDAVSDRMLTCNIQPNSAS
ncbi:hypothetical protein HN011_002666 [Eciton burchellii]|nr:hypothetical protein HN011_002666 [Eciton burchellii]